MSVRRKGPPARRERPTAYWRYRRAAAEEKPSAPVEPMGPFVGCRCPRCGHTTDRRWPTCITARCPNCGFPFMLRSLRRGSEAVAPGNRILA